MDRWYSVEERASEIAAVEHSKKKGGERVKALRPRSLLKALDSPGIISSAEIKSMLRTEYKNPVVSLYLRLAPEKLVPKGRGLARNFHSLRSGAMEERKAFIETLSQSQKETLTHDLNEIEAFLTQYFVPADLHSVLIFKSGEELNRVIRVWTRTADGLVIDVDPYVAPLEVVLEENEKVLLIQVSVGESRLLIYHLGYWQEADRIKTFVPRKSADAPTPGRDERHRFTHLQWHLKLTATKAYHLYHDEACKVLVLMGEKRVSNLLEDFLHDTLKSAIISRIYGSPAADPRDPKDIIETALRDHKRRRETQAIEELAEYRPDEVVSGLRDVIAVANLFLMRKLLVSQNLHQKGFVCKAHHYASLDKGDCPFCNAELLQVENIVDELVELAHLHGVSVMMIQHQQELMATHGGIAAVVYASVTNASAVAPG
jgi:Bacterial archaeo-eukaryotic release factor family 10